MENIEKSTHKAEVVRVFLKPHENSDNLSIVELWGYTVCVRTQDWKDGQLGVYIVPDTIVPVDNPLFEFLAKDAKNGKYRIRAKKLRGVQSFGLLIPCTKLDANEGDNFWEYLELEHYEPEIDVGPGSIATDNEKPPALPFLPGKYDIDSMRRYKDCFVEGELCRLTEKIHGHNSMYVWAEDRLWAKSRSFYKKPDERCLWWKQVKNVPQIEDFCKDNPGYFLYGEGYGKVKGFDYGRNGEVGFIAFDIRNPQGDFIGVEEYDRFINKYNIPSVPILADKLPFNFDEICKYVDGKTTVPNAKHIREGCVVRLYNERWNRYIGRVILKLVSVDYLERN